MDRQTKRGRSKQRILERSKIEASTSSGKRLTRSKVISARSRSSSSESVVIPGPLFSDEENTDFESVSAAEEEVLVMATTSTATVSVEAPPAIAMAQLPGVASTSSTQLAGVSRMQQDRGERNYGRSWSLAASSAAVSRWVDAESLIAVLYEIQSVWRRNVL